MSANVILLGHCKTPVYDDVYERDSAVVLRNYALQQRFTMADDLNGNRQ